MTRPAGSRSGPLKSAARAQHGTAAAPFLDTVMTPASPRRPGCRAAFEQFHDLRLVLGYDFGGSDLQ